MDFWVENWGGFLWGDFRQPCFWAKIKGGHFKNVKKTKKKLQNDKEKRKKRKKRRKIEKKSTKRCTICGVFSKSGNFLVGGAFRAGRS